MPDHRSFDELFDQARALLNENDLLFADYCRGIRDARKYLSQLKDGLADLQRFNAKCRESLAALRDDTPAAVAAALCESPRQVENAFSRVAG